MAQNESSMKTLTGELLLIADIQASVDKIEIMFDLGDQFRCALRHFMREVGINSGAAVIAYVGASDSSVKEEPEFAMARDMVDKMIDTPDECICGFHPERGGLTNA